MQNTLKNIKSGFVIGLTAIVVMIAGGVIYATLSFPDLNQVTSGETLTANKWNEMVNAVNSTKTEVNTISSNVTALSGTIQDVNMATPNVPASYDVLYNGKYYKSFGTTTKTWDNAFGSTTSAANADGCPSFGEGWRLPAMGELRDLYRAKTANSSYFTALNLQNGRYWSDDSFRNDSYGWRAILLNVDTGARNIDSKTDSHYVVCVHD